ncbi:MAG: N-acyl-D-amino-acid deacylase [Betaproteobacteria bacterium]|jgi:N-acyl-D-amino-acid deacylase|nr:N-acyl-D-amino-acid deacylase [Betaproteobacteria bacterium]
MAQKQHFDLIVRNATIIDGTKAPRYRGEIGVRDGRIAEIGMLDEASADVEIDASGLVAAPGFIDAHTHDDRLLLSDRDVVPKVSQGVTTVITGNCGISLAHSPKPQGEPTPPLDLLDSEGHWFKFQSFRAYREKLEAQPPAVNAACLVGHTTFRVATMDRLDRPASDAEIRAMRDMARESLGWGAIGISTGTAYPPAACAPTEEIIEVCRPLKEFGGLYVTHMRNEDDDITRSMAETFTIGRELGAPVIISHHKCVGTRNHGRSPETLALIERRSREQQVGLDCYPYIASSTVLRYDRLEQSSRVVITWSKPYPEFSGVDLEEVAQRLNVPKSQAVEMIKPAGAIYFMLDENDVQRILKYDDTMIGSDGLPHDAKPHPRLWGTFPRVLGHYSRDLKLFPLETAVYKMTGLTAAKFGLEGRGVLKPGAHADITVFNPDTIIDAADFKNSTRPAVGIHTVIVNGLPIWRDGRPTGERPGRVLTRSAGRGPGAVNSLNVV